MQPNFKKHCNFFLLLKQKMSLISTPHIMSGIVIVFLRINVLGSLKVKSEKLVDFCQWLFCLLLFFNLDQLLYTVQLLRAFGPRFLTEQSKYWSLLLGKEIL